MASRLGKKRLFLVWSCLVSILPGMAQTEKLIDYVAMDIKASRDNYARAAGLPHIDISRIEESIGVLKSSGIPYEFRTTVVKGIHTVAEFEKIGKWIAGCPAYYLQNYEENENCLYRVLRIGTGSWFLWDNM